MKSKPAARGKGVNDRSSGGGLTRRGLIAVGGLGALGLGLGVARAWPVAARLLFDDGNAAPRSAAGEPNTEAGNQGRGGPVYSDVASVEPMDALRYVAGRLPAYPGVTLDSMMAFAPADILETMDTDVLDTVQATAGDAARATLYGIIAEQMLESLLDLYGGAPVVLALDAGHGGKEGVYFDPGSQGTEWQHTRRVVTAVEERAAGPRYSSITVRRVFNDAIGDDFLLPPPNDRKGGAALSLRVIRASMLAREAAAWNQAHPEAPVAVHLLSVHFNAGSGGTLALHQGDSVPDALLRRSVAYATAYVDRVRPALNGTGLLPYQLRLALGTGLSDDRVLYEPNAAGRVSPINPYTGVDRSAFPRRYALLLTSLLEQDYVHGALIYHGLV
jgi:hypothetical protein